MAHTYSPITTADRTYTPVSDVTPEIDTFSWIIINPDYDTWIELNNSGKIRWNDWAFPWIDDWDSITAPSATYTSLTTPSKTYLEVT